LSAIYNPEADMMADIERLELEARDMRRRTAAALKNEDRRVLARQLEELEEQICRLQTRLPH
jgi:phosphate uptake regulator